MAFAAGFRARAELRRAGAGDGPAALGAIGVGLREMSGSGVVLCGWKRGSRGVGRGTTGMRKSGVCADDDPATAEAVVVLEEALDDFKAVEASPEIDAGGDALVELLAVLR